jgi:tol-pal system protein YbgF
VKAFNPGRSLAGWLGFLLVGILLGTGCAGQQPLPNPELVPEPEPKVEPKAEPKVEAPQHVVVPPPLSGDALKVLTQIEELQAQLRDLQGQVEMQNFELERLNQRQRDLYDDLDQRLRVRERIAQAPSGRQEIPEDSLIHKMEPLSQAEGAQIITEVKVAENNQEDMSQGTASTAEGDEVVATGGVVIPVAPTPTPTTAPTPAPTPAPAPPSVPSDPIAEQALYDEAFGYLKTGQYTESIATFKTLVETYPQSLLADDADYWMSEANYVTRDFEAALKGYRRVLSLYPESERIPDAMLKIGRIQYDIGAKEEARITFEAVIERFPGSRVAVAAEVKLKKMQQASDQ